MTTPQTAHEPVADRIARQNQEFEAMEALALAWRALAQTAVVEDDYPDLLRQYEQARNAYLAACRANEPSPDDEVQAAIFLAASMAMLSAIEIALSEGRKANEADDPAGFAVAWAIHNRLVAAHATLRARSVPPPAASVREPAA